VETEKLTNHLKNVMGVPDAWLIAHAALDTLKMIPKLCIVELKRVFLFF